MGRAVVRLLADGARVEAGAIHFEGRDLLTLREGEMRRLRSPAIALVPQDPRSALNPAFRERGRALIFLLAVASYRPGG